MEERFQFYHVFGLLQSTDGICWFVQIGKFSLLYDETEVVDFIIEEVFLHVERHAGMVQ